MTSPDADGEEGRKRLIKGLGVPTVVAVLVVAAVFGGFFMLEHPSQGGSPTIRVIAAASSGHS